MTPSNTPLPRLKHRKGQRIGKGGQRQYIQQPGDDVPPADEHFDYPVECSAPDEELNKEQKALKVTSM